MTYRQKIGTEYEYYVLNNIKKDYDKVWHWSNFPEKLMYECNLINDYDKFKKYRIDVGADLVALKDNKYYFIQCKNFNDNNSICTEKLAGFYFLLYEYSLNGVLYYNGKISERLVDLSNKKVPFINLPFNNENIIFQEPQNKIVPRDYQIEAYNKLKGLDNSILNLPCSMGKTFISSLLAKDYENIIILSPTRALTQQTLEKFKEYLGDKYNYVLVSIDGKTKIEEIKKIIKAKNVISSTYDSCDIVNLLMNDLQNSYVIIDEFHNLSENNIKDNNNEIKKLINTNINKVFVSATPIKNFMNITEDKIYTYKWDDAIKNKYICDFNIYLPNITDEMTKFIDVVKINYKENEIKLIKKAYNLIKSMLFNGDKKCICYLTTIEKANTFNKLLTLIGNTLNIEIEREQIDCNTKKLKRNEIIEKFKKSNKMFILLNVHVLDEGIDIPECDSVYITQPNNNILNIVQRMCRSNRIYDDKTECNIYLWCTENKINKIMEYMFIKTNDFFKNKIYQIINKKIIRKEILNEINQNKYVENNNSFIHLLKKNTNIDHDFIDTFLTKFKIGGELNFDIKDTEVSKFLGITLQSLRNRLLNQNSKTKLYFEKVDYLKIKSNKSNASITYMLNYQCFEKLAMSGDSKCSEIIRLYFIKLRQFITEKLTSHLINNYK
jgi:superfamily II DNA or RNA helicase